MKLKLGNKTEKDSYLNFDNKVISSGLGLLAITVEGCDAQRSLPLDDRAFDSGASSYSIGGLDVHLMRAIDYINKGVRSWK